MDKTFSLTLTGSEMITLRAALNIYKVDRHEQVNEAMNAQDTKAAEYFDNQRGRADQLYAKVFYQHEDQCSD